MSSGAPVEMYWDPEADALRPTGGWLSRARKAFVAGEIYHVVNQEPRSHASHGHYFARVEEVWRNLPEDQTERFPTDEHLRRHALIRTGWCNRQEVACGSRAAALELAKVIKSLDTYAIVDVPQGGSVAAILTARSQSQSAMGRADFQQSKNRRLGLFGRHDWRYASPARQDGCSMNICSQENCGKPVIARGLCRKHYMRWYIHGDPAKLKVAEKGSPKAFIDALPMEGVGCITWPYATNGAGYGQINGPAGKRLVSRIACEKKNGPAPSNIHEAAHSCGRGHLGCVAPYHLAWKSPSENHADLKLHGTLLTGEDHPNSKITEDDVRAIRALRGKQPQTQIAEQFGISQTCVSGIQRGVRWKEVV